jgi:hypothetical protein
MAFFEHIRHAKNVAAAIGVGGVVYSAYTVSGLPLPATVYQVDHKIEAVQSSIQEVTFEVIETQRSVLALRRSALRTERYTLAKSAETEQATRRLGEIDDELVDIGKKEDLLGSKVRGIRSAVRAPT